MYLPQNILVQRAEFTLEFSELQTSDRTWTRQEVCALFLFLHSNLVSLGAPILCWAFSKSPRRVALIIYLLAQQQHHLKADQWFSTSLQVCWIGNYGSRASNVCFYKPTRWFWHIPRCEVTPPVCQHVVPSCFTSVFWSWIPVAPLMLYVICLVH